MDETRATQEHGRKPHPVTPRPGCVQLARVPRRFHGGRGGRTDVPRCGRCLFVSHFQKIHPLPAIIRPQRPAAGRISPRSARREAGGLLVIAPPRVATGRVFLSVARDGAAQSEAPADSTPPPVGRRGDGDTTPLRASRISPRHRPGQLKGRAMDRDVPIVKLGPGGDYVRCWPDPAAPRRPRHNSLIARARRWAGRRVARAARGGKETA
jgi:hypothetical protein